MQVVEQWAATKTKEVLVARQIFSLFDADEDGKLSKSEYKSYLHGIGASGTLDVLEEDQVCVATSLHSAFGMGAVTCAIVRSLDHGLTLRFHF